MLNLRNIKLNLHKCAEVSSLLPTIKEIYEFEYKMSQSTNSAYTKFYAQELNKALTLILPKIADEIISWHQEHDLEPPAESSYITLEDLIKESVDLKEEEYMSSWITTVNNLKNAYHQIIDVINQGGDINTKLKVFHYAVQAQHQTGKLVRDYMFKRPEFSEFDKLSEGEYISQWDIDIRKEDYNFPGNLPPGISSRLNMKKAI